MTKFSSKAVRQIDLILYLLNSNLPVTLEDIKNNVEGYKKRKKEDIYNIAAAEEKEESESEKETVRKMLERDKKELRELGIPVEYDSETEAYRIFKSNFYLPSLELNDEEKTILKLFINLLLTTIRFPFLKNELLSSLQKLALSGFGGLDKKDLFATQIVLTNQVKKLRPDIDSILSAVADAIFDKKRLRFLYPPGEDDKLKRRCVDPLGLLFREGVPYLAGYCHWRKSVRIFNLFRVNELTACKIEKDEIKCTVPEDFHIEKFSRKEVWEFENEPPYIAEIRFSPEIGWLIESQFSSKVPIEHLENGDIIFKPTVSNTEGIASFVLSFEAKCVVEKPEKLRQYIRNEITNILYQYSTLL